MRTTGQFAMIGMGAVFAAAMSATAFTPVTAQAADAVLTGTIRSADGAALGGVTVSARSDGSNVVTSVFTDETGNYYFPPMATGKYKVWAQAITFDTGRGDLDLGAARRHGLHAQAVQGLRAPAAGRHDHRGAARRHA